MISVSLLGASIHVILVALIHFMMWSLQVSVIIPMTDFTCLCSLTIQMSSTLNGVSALSDMLFLFVPHKRGSNNN